MTLPRSAPAPIFGADSLASVIHRDQRRTDAHGSAYINHLIEAAHRLATVRGFTDAVPSSPARTAPALSSNRGHG